MASTRKHSAGVGGGTEGKRPVGRPRLVLDEATVEELAGIGCTNEEIGTLLGCHVDTLSDNFSKPLESGRANLRMSLRRVQWSAAKEGNTAMQIWLGKNLLGQKDKLEHSGDDDHPIKHEHNLSALSLEELRATRDALAG